MIFSSIYRRLLRSPGVVKTQVLTDLKGQGVGMAKAIVDGIVQWLEEKGE